VRRAWLRAGPRGKKPRLGQLSSETTWCAPLHAADGRAAALPRASRAALTTLSLLSSFLALPAALRAQDDTVLVEAVIRLDLQYGPADIVPALASETRLLLPLLRFLQMAEIGTTAVEPGHSVAARLEPTGLDLRFDTDSARLTLGDSSESLGRWDARWLDGELYVHTDALSAAFGVVVGIDWEALTAVVARTQGLPVARRARRERQRLLALRPRAPRAAATALVEPRPAADGAVLDWSLSSGGTFDDASARLGLGAQLLGGSLEMEYEGHYFPGGNVSRAEASWMRAWPEREDVRQVRLGDVPTGGRRSRLLRGFVVTNQPFLRSSEFGLQELVGELPPGWEVELYDAYGLLDFGLADPGGEFRVGFPLRYGANPFDMVLYGPRGEVVRRNRTIRVPFSRIPDGRFEYAVGAGACRTDPCDAVVTADARYGVSSRVTAQAGWDVLTRGDSSDLLQPYVALSAGVLPSVSLTAEAVAQGLVRGQAEFEPNPDLRVQLAQTFYDADGAPFLGAPLDRRRTDIDLLWQTYGRFSIVYQAAAARASGPQAARAFYRASATGRWAGARLSTEVRHLRSTLGTAPRLVQTVLDLSGDVTARGGPEWFRGATLGGGFGVDPGRGLASIRALGSRVIARAVRVEMGLGWFRDQGGFALDLGLTSTLPGPRVGSRSRFTSGAGTHGVQYADGSLLWDRQAGRVRVGDGRDLGRAGVGGVVFLDLNGNGAPEEDEPRLEGIPVRVGGWLSETDERGRFSAWELFPFEPVLLQVDTTAFENPFYVLPDRLLEVVPAPNSFESVNIPVVLGAEVTGRVTFEDRGLGGVRLALRDLNRGRLVRLLTFSDGGFYVLGLPPGDYELGLANGLPAGVRASAEPVRFTVPVGGGEKRVEGLIVRLERE
jgi:hypothetical protein